MTFLLVVLLCPGDCNWHRVASFPTHEACVAAGKEAKKDDHVLVFHCVMQ